ncbi:MAG: peptide deformylase [Anaerolineae bacterium]
MTIRKIRVIDDPVLRRKAKKVEKITPEIRELIEDMIETMRAAPGVGLAAPQVGVSERVIVIEYADEPEDDDETNAPPPKKKLYAVVNPEIIWTSDEKVEGTEGCLSIPGWVGDVSRHEAIAVKGVNRSGQKIKLNLEGWLARIFQHEIDHLDGVLYTDRLVSPETLRRVTPGEEENSDLKAEAIG